MRPKPKMAASRAPEPEKKGKKGAQLAKAAPAKSKAKSAATRQANGKEKSQDKKLTATRNQRNQPAAKVFSKAGTRLADKKGKKGQDRHRAANARNKAGDNQLVSRLTNAKLVPASFLGNERRGKFGKADTLAKRSNDRATSANPPHTAAPQATHQSDRQHEASRPSRQDERNAESVAEQDNSPKARRPRVASHNEEPPYNIARPDKIEVTEYGSTSAALAKLLALPDARPLTPFGAVVTRGNSQPSKRNDLVMPQQRVLEIQYELAKRGFYSAEPNGVYDETTLLAMWEFQKNYGLPATGYPTAHSLKRLGLTSW